jgi:hypothetical protein
MALHTRHNHNSVHVFGHTSPPVEADYRYYYLWTIPRNNCPKMTTMSGGGGNCCLLRRSVDHSNHLHDDGSGDHNNHQRSDEIVMNGNNHRHCCCNTSDHRHHDGGIDCCHNHCTPMDYQNNFHRRRMMIRNNWDTNSLFLSLRSNQQTVR